MHGHRTPWAGLAPWGYGLKRRVAGGACRACSAIWEGDRRLFWIGSLPLVWVNFRKHGPVAVAVAVLLLGHEIERRSPKAQGQDQVGVFRQGSGPFRPGRRPWTLPGNR